MRSTSGTVTAAQSQFPSLRASALAPSDVRECHAGRYRPRSRVTTKHGSRGIASHRTLIDLPGSVSDPDGSIAMTLGHDILVVDDVPANLLAFEAALAPLGHRVVTVRSGMEALGLLLEQDFAVVLLDAQMPEMDGFDTDRASARAPFRSSS
jgi:hypothetical protein